jgi:hypothetical protein
VTVSIPAISATVLPSVRWRAISRRRDVSGGSYGDMVGDSIWNPDTRSAAWTISEACQGYRERVAHTVAPAQDAVTSDGIENRAHHGYAHTPL